MVVDHYRPAAMGADAESSCTESRTDSWSQDRARNPWSAPTTELWAPTRPGLPTGCDCLLYHPMKKNDQRRCENIALLISRSHSALA